MNYGKRFLYIMASALGMTVAITGMEQVLTLSTCTSRTKTERFTVNAILQESWENQEAY